MPKLYNRNQGGNLRYYADLRDIGGGQVALKPPGSSRATTDEIEAHKLLARKIEEIQGKVSAGGSARLKPFVDGFIQQNPGEVTEQWLHDTERRLLKAIEYFGADRDLVSIEPKDIREWLNKELSHLANGTQRHYVHALSGLYRYAQELGVVPVGYNPFGGLYRKPSIVAIQWTDTVFEFFFVLHPRWSQKLPASSDAQGSGRQPNPPRLEASWQPDRQGFTLPPSALRS